jgi:hypothetical protein
MLRKITGDVRRRSFIRQIPADAFLAELYCGPADPDDALRQHTRESFWSHMSLDSNESALPEAPRQATAVSVTSRGADWNVLLFYGLIALLLVPLWAFRFFPTSDGPLHVYSAVVARDYDRGDRPRFREFFERNTRMVPNWIGPHLLSFLVGVVPPEIAEKIMWSAYLILLPVGVRYALWAIRPRAASLSIVAIPFVPNACYHMGFLDFCLALSVFFFVVGYWLKHRRHFGWPQAIVLAALLLVCYFCHLVPAAMAGLFIAVLALTTGGGGIKSRLRRLAPVIAAGGPAALLAICFVLGPRPAFTLSGVQYTTLSRLGELGKFQKAFARREVLLVAINCALFAGVSIWLLWRRRGRRFIVGLDAFLLLSALCLALLLVVPDAGAGGSMLVMRLPFFVFLALVLWWGVQPLGSEAFRRLRLASTTTSVVVSLLLIASMSVSYAQVTPYLQDMETAVRRIEPNSTLMLISFGTTYAPDGQLVVHGPNVFDHGGYRQAAERGIVSVAFMLATTHYHPMRYRPGLDPGYNPVDFTGYAARIGKKIDYVLLWTGGTNPDDPRARLIRKQLQDGYDLVFTSPQTGYAKLYRRKDWSPPRDGSPAEASRL